MRYILSNYIEVALSEAEYEKLEVGSYAGKISSCDGVVAFGETLRECENELRSTLEDWVYIGLRLGHHLPVLKGINLNRKLRRGTMESL